MYVRRAWEVERNIISLTDGVTLVLCKVLHILTIVLKGEDRRTFGFGW